MTSNKRILLLPDQVWTDGETHRSWCVLVDGARIAAAGSRQSVGEVGDCELIELSGCTLLPGLMDLHSHLFLHPYNETSWDDQVLKETEAYRTARAVRHAETTLMAGFTTLRDLGTEGAGYADVSLKRAIEDGIVAGPRLFVAGRAIVATGSYGPARRNYRTDCCFPQGALEASGVDEIVRAVRIEAAHGADWIKLYGDYRVGPNSETRPTFSQEELNAAVAAAHDLGRPVAVHAMTDEAMQRAARAGVQTIEHGYGGSRETFALMREKGVAFLPTLTVSEALSEYFRGYVPGESDPTESMQMAAQGFHNARAEGIVIGCGSDVGPFPHGENVRELIWMTRLGMTSAQALTAATAMNAKILGKENELGSIRRGYFADLIAVQGQPVEDVATVTHPQFVMKNGALIAAPAAVDVSRAIVLTQRGAGPPINE
ncbi:MAG TPA: amidohydrolase family protein [Rhizomicrobium sp.]|jgi:imidazolonepropionase-like amidohydrolase|nr:amidohydrolase family protein [Rhizomicrobium sp.]